MEKFFTALEQMGFDRKPTMERFLEDEEFYVDCYRQMITDVGFERLGETLNSHQTKEAFECAHMLKGIVSNMGITPMYNKLVDIVEPLRNNEDNGLSDAYQELMNLREQYKNLLELL